MKKPSKQKFARLYAGRKTPFWDKLTGRKHHRLSASVTGESDWEVETPQIRMSRAFAILLVLHVIAVGGLFAYRIWGRDEAPPRDAPQAAMAPAAEQTPAYLPLPQPVAALPAPAAESAEVKTYTWRAGDSIQLIAARFGVSTAALREANPDKALVPGTELILPRAGRVFDGPVLDAPLKGASPIFDPGAAVAQTSEAAEPPAPRARLVAEIPEDSEVPDVIPPAVEEASIQVKPVAALPAVRDEPKAATPKKAREVKEKPAPAGKTTAAATIAANPSKTPAVTRQPARTAGQRVHVVTKGDTVYNLAKRYGFTADEIAKVNGIGSDYRITLGQQLKVPVKR
jgi:LysM repeat protein